MEAAQPICIAFSNADVSKSEVLISSNAIGVTGGNEGIITIPRFAGDWGVYRIVFFDKGLSVNAIVWFWVNSKAVVFGDTITTGNINLDGGLFSKNNIISINDIVTSNVSSIIGMPKGAYGYGRLITITSSHYDYVCIQIYVPHNGEYNYVRSMVNYIKDANNASWRAIKQHASIEPVKLS